MVNSYGGIEKSAIEFSILKLCNVKHLVRIRVC
jgi:hypothetical protein